MLLFDAGNSRCKWAWVENGIWLRQGVLDNMDHAAWQQTKFTFARLAAPDKILLSNVAGAAMVQKLRDLCDAWPCHMQLIVAQAEQCGVRNSYQHAALLGSDRWASLIAARHRVNEACLVVNCGTATTVDALSATGEFLGGLILPGMELMRHSLLHNTAGLGHVNIGPVNTELANIESGKGELRDFPRNTADAIASGVVRATIGAIQYQYRLLAAPHGAHCLLSGGAANSILPHLGFQAEQVDNLVLHGMQIIAQNCSIIKNRHQ